MSRKIPGFTALAALAAAFSLSACDYDGKAADAPAPAPTATPVAQPLELVIFEATWCVNSAATEAIIEQFQAAHPGRITVSRVDIDQHPDAVADHGIQGTPTIIFQRDGQPVARNLGAVVSVDEMKTLVDTATTEKTLQETLRSSSAPPVQTVIAPAR